MNHYRVSVWASVDLFANNEDDAVDIVNNMLIDQQIRIKEFELTPELIEE